jgi:hypothetical protein
MHLVLSTLRVGCREHLGIHPYHDVHRVDQVTATPFSQVFTDMFGTD